MKRGQNPKIIIATRKLATSNEGELLSAPSEVDVEIRNVWQPWLKSRCNFAVRYVVPDRQNIIKIMQTQGKFTSQVRLDEDESGESVLYHEMIFRPRLKDRLIGKTSTTVWRKLPSSVLDGTRKSRSGIGRLAKKSARAIGTLPALSEKLEKKELIEITSKKNKKKQIEVDKGLQVEKMETTPKTKTTLSLSFSGLDHLKAKVSKNAESKVDDVKAMFVKLKEKVPLQKTIATKS